MRKETKVYFSDQNAIFNKHYLRQIPTCTYIEPSFYSKIFLVGSVTLPVMLRMWHLHYCNTDDKASISVKH